MSDDLDQRDGSSFTPAPPPEGARDGWREPTEMERNRVRALGQCSLPPGTGKKRFIRETADAERHRGAAWKITDRQAHYIQVLAWHFRRQLPRKLVPPCEPAPFGVKRRPNELAGVVSTPAAGGRRSRDRREPARPQDDLP